MENTSLLDSFGSFDPFASYLSDEPDIKHPALSINFDLDPTDSLSHKEICLPIVYPPLFLMNSFLPLPLSLPSPLLPPPIDIPLLPPPILDIPSLRVKVPGLKSLIRVRPVKPFVKKEIPHAMKIYEVNVTSKLKLISMHPMKMRKRKRTCPQLPDQSIKKKRVSAIIKCIECNSSATFGVANQESVVYCFYHAPSHYVRHGLYCLKCDKSPCYGRPGTSIPFYCKLHCPKKYINIISKKCKLCDNPAYYGDATDRIVIYCRTHAPKRFINVSRKTCIVSHCPNVVQVGPVFQKKTRCCKHGTPNDYIRMFPKCDAHNCEKNAYYTYQKQYYPRRCYHHSLVTDVMLKLKLCKKCKVSFAMPNDCTVCYDCSTN